MENHLLNLMFLERTFDKSRSGSLMEVFLELIKFNKKKKVSE